MTLQEAIEEVKRYGKWMDEMNLRDIDYILTHPSGIEAIATILNAVVKGQLTCK